MRDLLTISSNSSNYFESVSTHLSEDHHERVFLYRIKLMMCECVYRFLLTISNIKINLNLNIIVETLFSRCAVALHFVTITVNAIINSPSTICLLILITLAYN